MELMMKSLFVVAIILFVENSQVLTDENTDSICSGWLLFRKQNGASGVITGPNYPGTYGDNLYCVWRIETPQNILLRKSFDPIFEVESYTTSDTRYCRDKVFIFTYRSSPPTRYYSGEVDIRFTSDNSSSYHKGFKLRWWLLEVDSRLCSKTPIIQNGRSGVITSPNHPGNYYKRLNCSWAIVVPEKTILALGPAGLN
ncbi:embryonic protein UVS.2-like isoform X2 [Tubulanus polymorphus]|uniref:embryonic protein UVS.2-like isoform X2 n=1 Tax=Tubulanus polymorphus TaxID=672921 RepID=UPI003DA28D8B